MRKFSAAILLFALGCALAFTAERSGAQTIQSFYVAVDGADENPGTKDKPFATLERARDAVRQFKRDELPRKFVPAINVVLRGGRHERSSSFILTHEDSGVGVPGDDIKFTQIQYIAAPGEKPVISGGRVITGWQNAKDNLWTVELPDVKNGKWYFRQLFADGKRLTRARTPNDGFFITAGALTKYAERAKKRYGGYNGVSNLRRENPDAYCGFQFKAGDVQAWPDFADAEVITYHSWECSWQTIRQIDLAKRDLHFNTPCRYPIGFFSLNARYRIENVKAALDAPGEWLLNKKTGALSYLARPGEDPRKMKFIAPALEQLIVIKDDPHTGKLTETITFLGLSFQHTQYPMGIYDVARDWPKAAQKVFPDWPTEFNPGYTDSQAAPRCGQAVELTGARIIDFQSCEFAHLGANAVKFGRRCQGNAVRYCHLHDLGGGGVLIGDDSRSVGPGRLEFADAPTLNMVVDNRILNGGIVHPSAVAVWIAQSHHNTVARNEIANWGYSGISLGWTWGRGENYSHANLIEKNHIHHVLQALADGGGIYTLGALYNCVIRENYIHDIQRPAGAIGSHNNGMFLDEGSQLLRVERNVTRNIGHLPVRHNQNVHDDHTWIDNDFEESRRSNANDKKPPKPNRLDSESIIRNAGPQRETAQR